ncbi:NTP transferase domain-containing protein [Altererythrobacter fulvus]|uniref:phosphocholine cytidylyltransferase family protein n=1 Tax=Caenibius fulvus TaxID=2126012 RepID=UPI003019BEC1
MDALILAAGLGSRLRNLSDCKPLTPVAGISLLELGVRQAARAGAGRVVVVTGHEAARIEAALPAISRQAGLPVEAVRVADWSLPNGHSVLAGASVVDGEYLLTMADHIFSLPILRALKRQGTPDRGVTLAIDRKTDNPLVDPEDATWVKTGPDGRIRAIGKTIPDFDAVDCGAFLATPELAEAIAEAIAMGLPGSLSDGMQRLADRGRAATMDIGDAWWIDVDDPAAHARAEIGVRLHLGDVFEQAGTPGCAVPAS